MNLNVTYSGKEYSNWAAADLLAAGVPLAAILASLQVQLKDAIDGAAGRARARHITTTPGQESTYIAKGLEADRYLADGSPADGTPYVMLTAEASALGISVSVLAEQVIATRAAWLYLAGAVEAARLGGKSEVVAAETVEAAEAAAGVAIAALNAI